MSKSKNISFEDAILNLETAISRLESGDLTLDESLSEFERAIGFVKLCESRLEDAKQKVKILVEGVDGTVTDMPFDGASGDEA